MRSKNWKLVLPVLIFLAAASLLAHRALRGDSAAPGGTAPAVAPPLEGFRRDLLEIAFQAACALPLDPHVKNRSRAQEVVVRSYLDLDEPGMALAGAKEIADWRRGLAYAELAHWCATHGRPEEAQAHLGVADRIANDVLKEESGQAWRRDRIRVGIARAYIALDNQSMAASFAAEVVDSESGKVEGSRALVLPEEKLDAELAAIDAVIESSNFDRTRNALATCEQLFGRFYDDRVRRELIEKRINSPAIRVPVGVRLDLQCGLAETALEHGDAAKALLLIGEARTIAEGIAFQPQDRIQMFARLAALRSRAGERDAARNDLAGLLLAYDSGRETIVDIWRARALRALAEALKAADDVPVALDVYRRAVEEGTVNPNSRPRAEDLAATCVSMAVHGVAPDDRLWARIRAVRAGLGPPW